MDTEKSNKLIAEFLGWEYHKEEYYPNEYDWFWFDLSKVVNARHFELKFHESWDWLMPVVEKVESTHHYQDVTINNNRCTMMSWASDECFEYFSKAESKLEATYEAVVEFIKWYNKNE